jgi:hypothetical protein
MTVEASTLLDHMDLDGRWVDILDMYHECVTVSGDLAILRPIFAVVDVPLLRWTLSECHKNNLKTTNREQKIVTGWVKKTYVLLVVSIVGDEAFVVSASGEGYGWLSINMLICISR